MRHASKRPGRNQPAVAIEHVGDARGRLLEHRLVGPEAGSSGRRARAKAPPLSTPSIHSSSWGWPRVRESIRNGLVWSAVPYTTASSSPLVVSRAPNGNPHCPRTGRPHRPRREGARLEFDVGTPHLRIGQQEKARTVGLESIQVRPVAVDVSTAPTLVEHHDVAVQRLIRRPEELDELQAVRHRVAVGIHLVEEHLLGRSARDSEEEGQEGEDPLGEVCRGRMANALESAAKLRRLLMPRLTCDEIRASIRPYLPGAQDPAGTLQRRDPRNGPTTRGTQGPAGRLRPEVPPQRNAAGRAHLAACVPVAWLVVRPRSHGALRHDRPNGPVLPVRHGRRPWPSRTSSSHHAARAPPVRIGSRRGGPHHRAPFSRHRRPAAQHAAAPIQSRRHGRRRPEAHPRVHCPAQRPTPPLSVHFRGGLW